MEDYKKKCTLWFWTNIYPLLQDISVENIPHLIINDLSFLNLSYKSFFFSEGSIMNYEAYVTSDLYDSI